MVWSLVSPKRRRRLVFEAHRSRRNESAAAAAALAVIVYNIVGVLDIVSTTLGLAGGGAQEANPVIRAAMENFGAGWIGAKLLLQAVISAMVLWFPHRIVLVIFAMAIALNLGVVYGNFGIAGAW